MKKVSFEYSDIQGPLRRAKRWLNAQMMSATYDKTDAEAAVKNVYRVFGRREPEVWLHFDSPDLGNCAAWVLSQIPESGSYYSHFIQNRVQKIIMDIMKSHLTSSSREVFYERIECSGKVNKIARLLINARYGFTDLFSSCYPGIRNTLAVQIRRQVARNASCASGKESLQDCFSTLKGWIGALSHAPDYFLNHRNSDTYYSNEKIYRDIHRWIDLNDKQIRGTPLWILRKLEYLILREMGIASPSPVVESVIEADRHCRWFAFENIAVLIRHPVQFHYDKKCRLHNPDGPAVAYADGIKHFRVHGIKMPECYYGNPHTMTAKDIEKETNAEVRHNMISKYGIRQYLHDSKLRPVCVDKYGELYKSKGKNESAGPIAIVKVKNATREPDGSFKEYCLFVPPDMETAREAVAWTFGMKPEEYNLTEES